MIAPACDEEAFCRVLQCQHECPECGEECLGPCEGDNAAACAACAGEQDLIEECRGE